MAKSLKKDTMSIITAILFFIVGVLLFSNPDGVIKFISYVIGALFIITGIVKLFSYYRMSKKMNITNNGDLILGIIAIIIGFVVIICLSAIAFIINFAIGGWILYSGIMKLITAFSLKELKVDSWIYVLITSIVMILCGLYVVINFNTAYKIIGLVLIIYSIVEIIQYIVIPKNINPDIIK